MPLTPLRAVAFSEIQNVRDDRSRRLLMSILEKVIAFETRSRAHFSTIGTNDKAKQIVDDDKDIIHRIVVAL